MRTTWRPAHGRRRSVTSCRCRSRGTPPTGVLHACHPRRQRRGSGRLLPAVVWPREAGSGAVWPGGGRIRGGVAVGEAGSGRRGRGERPDPGAVAGGEVGSGRRGRGRGRIWGAVAGGDPEASGVVGGEVGAAGRRRRCPSRSASPPAPMPGETLAKLLDLGVGLQEIGGRAGRIWWCGSKAQRRMRTKGIGRGGWNFNNKK